MHGPQNSSINITWEISEKQIQNLIPPTSDLETLGGAQQSVFQQVFPVIVMLSEV